MSCYQYREIFKVVVAGGSLDEGGDPELEQQLFQKKHGRPAPTVHKNFSGRSTLLSQLLVWFLGFCLLVQCLHTG